MYICEANYNIKNHNYKEEKVMRKRKVMALILALAMAAGALTGCGGSDDKADSGKSGKSEKRGGKPKNPYADTGAEGSERSNGCIK